MNIGGLKYNKLLLILIVFYTLYFEGFLWFLWYVWGGFALSDNGSQ